MFPDMPAGQERFARHDARMLGLPLRVVVPVFGGTTSIEVLL
jgi:hypothetical protein